MSSLALIAGLFVGAARAEFVAAGVSAGPELSTVTLGQCYAWAAARSEELKIRAEDVEQSRQRARAALAGALPSLAFELVDTYQDPEGVNKLDAEGFSGFINKNQNESRFALRQPLFSGLREWNALAGFKRQRERDAWRLKRGERALYESVAEAYYEVVGLELERANTADSYALALDRVKELRGFTRLGKARETEVFTAQARAAALKAALRGGESRVKAAREDLSFLAGRDLSRAPLSDDLPDRPSIVSLGEAQTLARERSDVIAQREDVAANERLIRYEKGSYWPALDLLGRYYTHRDTFVKEIKWDVTLNLSVPLFQGGRVSANVKRALAAYRQSQLALAELERRAVSLVGKLRGELVSSLDELDAQEEAAAAAKKSYEALREEYALGLVTNLDVLQALDLLASQRAARNAARMQVKRLVIALGVATEKLP